MTIVKLTASCKDRSLLVWRDADGMKPNSHVALHALCAVRGAEPHAHTAQLAAWRGAARAMAMPADVARVAGRPYPKPYRTHTATRDNVTAHPHPMVQPSTESLCASAHPLAHAMRKQVSPPLESGRRCTHNSRTHQRQPYSHPLTVTTASCTTHPTASNLTPAPTPPLHAPRVHAPERTRP